LFLLKISTTCFGRLEVKMNRWITQAVVFGVALSEAVANPLNPSQSISLSSGSNPDGNDGANPPGFNPATVYFRYLDQCAESNLDTDSCLVSNTFLAISEMESPPTGDNDDGDDTDFLGRRRFLEDDCSTPEVDEEDLRLVMVGIKEQCGTTDQEFESAVDGFVKIFDSDSCFQQLCEDASDLSGLFLEIMLDDAAKCANVELDINQCIMDNVFETMSDVGDSDSNSDAERVRRKLIDSLDSQDSSSCEESSYEELEFYLSFVLMGSETNCSVTTEEITKATSDLATIFTTQHCWFNDCEENHEDYSDNDDYLEDDCWDDGCDDDHGVIIEDGLDYFNIAIKYIEQCSGLDLNTTTCLASSTIDTFTEWGTAPNVQSQNNHHRLLETSEDDECTPPEFDEPSMRYIVEESKQQCMIRGHVISDQELNETVGDFMDFFGAESCWISLCEEESSPSEMMLQIMFEEIAQCAGAELDFNPCLLDQIFQIVFFSEDSDDSFDGVRRKLEEALSSSDEPTEPCDDQLDDTDLQFAIDVLLAGAEEQCMEMGEAFESGEVDRAKSELFKLFGAQHCWGVSHDCNDDKGDNLYGEHHTSYLEFIEESTTLMLGQCVDTDVENVSCVFSRSVEVIHGMKRFGWSYDGDGHHSDLAQDSVSSICAPPSEEEYDVEQITSHAVDHCREAGATVIDSHHNQTVVDLNYLTANPDCWEDLCEPEAKELIAEEWMHQCASIDLKFLTTHGPHMVGEASLDSDILRCMANYIAAEKWGFDAHWACSLPQLGDDICGPNPTDHGTGKYAYFHCADEGETLPPSLSPPMKPTAHPSRHPSMHLSMSFAYNDEFDWTEYDPDMSLSMSLRLDDDDDDDVHKQESEMTLYIETVCGLIDELNTDIAQDCLQPVCDIGLDDVFTDSGDSNHLDSHEPTMTPTSELTTMQTTMPTTMPTTEPTTEPTHTTTKAPTGDAFVGDSSRPPTLRPTTQVPTAKIIYLPTLKPTLLPTRLPTPSPTVQQLGSVEVSFEVGVTLDGINVSDLDPTALDDVVNLLQSVFGDLLPEGAIVRILSVGGFSVTRRMLRFLEENISGVEVEFEVIMTQTCTSAKCEDSETNAISTTLYEDVTSNLKTKVESGELTTSIQEKAEVSGVSALSDVSISADSLQVSEAKVTVKEASEEENPVDPPDDDDSASSRRGPGVTLSVLAGFVSVMFLLHII